MSVRSVAWKKKITKAIMSKYKVDGRDRLSRKGHDYFLPHNQEIGHKARTRRYGSRIQHIVLCYSILIYQ